MKFDLVSDLHIDFWNDRTINNSWIEYKSSDILVVAGDTSDYPEWTRYYLNELCAIYKTVLYIDGNHEHEKTTEMPRISTDKFKKESGLCKAHYLKNSSYVIDNTVFIGATGWYSFDFAEPKISTQDVIEKFKEQSNASDQWINDQLAMSKEDAKHIESEVDRYTNDDSIANIVVVTHMLPHRKLFTKEERIRHDFYEGMYGNAQLERSIEKNSKIKYWCFGHTHRHINENLYNINFVAHPRGRPRDYNRIEYAPLTLEI